PRGVAASRRARGGDRLPPRLARGPAEGGAHRARAGEGRAGARGLCARRGTRLPATPVFSGIPPALVCEQALETLEVGERDLPILHVEQTVLVERRKQAAHRFD